MKTEEERAKEEWNDKEELLTRSVKLEDVLKVIENIRDRYSNSSDEDLIFDELKQELSKLGE